MGKPKINWPDLTLPDEEAGLLRSVYRDADVILEYGSGGSTIMAGQMPGKLIFSVESDRSWARSLQSKVDTANLSSEVITYHVDIGATGAWGRPVDDSQWPKFYRYPLSIWTEPFFRHPDVILIDGRLRPACLVAACLQIEKPVTVLFDDYVDRKSYHVVESLVQPSAIVGRMAQFRLEPQDWPNWTQALLLELCTQMTYVLQECGEHKKFYNQQRSDVLKHAGLR